MTTTQTAQAVLDLDRWSKTFASSAAAYQKAYPYPFASFDNFLEPEAARAAMNAFPGVKDDGWIHYVHVNEKKHGLNKMDLIPEDIREVIKVLNSAPFVTALSELTGIPNLIPDPSLEGGGLHQSKRGGFLNIHADFTVHPHKRNWRRRVNVLVYLNENWQPEYRGELELWTRDMKACAQKILPVFNRCAIFNTDEDSFHGLPEPIQCPEEMTRKSIALYYFTEEQNIPHRRATNYRARPEDGSRRILIWLDKQAVSWYTSLKGWLGINDAFVSKLLNFLSGKKK
ncbi:MAG: 2OG-Fe(II) oxygenase [Lewinellaceae bacterium]|jgi:Rps23 Pro-64 3,4-dihydroxylase Tpa1-like proline 4-hydroxylase|nr:2OG-Fe(II) oxygenase [Lewinellaceae bacterium]